MASLLGLGLGLMLALSLPGARALDCESLGPATRLTFTRAARDRWLAPRVRAPGPLDHLYGTVRRFLSTVQLNPFPAGECALPRRATGGTGSWPAPCPLPSWSRVFGGRDPQHSHPHLPAQGHHLETLPGPSCVTLGEPFSSLSLSL